MNLSPRIRLIVFGYGLLGLSAATSLVHSGFQFSGLGWLQVAVWAGWVRLMPTVMRLHQMYRAWGWMFLLACIVTVFSGPLVAAKPGPWALYLGDALITAYGAYLFLFDKQVQQYASVLEKRTVVTV